MVLLSLWVKKRSGIEPKVQSYTNYIPLTGLHKCRTFYIKKRPTLFVIVMVTDFMSVNQNISSKLLAGYSTVMNRRAIF